MTRARPAGPRMSDQYRAALFVATTHRDKGH